MIDKEVTEQMLRTIKTYRGCTREQIAAQIHRSIDNMNKAIGIPHYDCAMLMLTKTCEYILSTLPAEENQQSIKK